MVWYVRCMYHIIIVLMIIYDLGFFGHDFPATSVPAVVY